MSSAHRFKQSQKHLLIFELSTCSSYTKNMVVLKALKKVPTIKENRVKNKKTKKTLLLSKIKKQKDM